MSDVMNKLERTSEVLDINIKKTRESGTIVAEALSPVLSRVERIIVSAATAHSEGKVMGIVVMDELMKLKNDLTMRIISEQQSLLTLSGQKSGIEAAITAMKQEQEEQDQALVQEELDKRSVQRTKDRIETGDLKIEGPRATGSRPEALKNVRKAQEEIAKEGAEIRDTMFRT